MPTPNLFAISDVEKHSTTVHSLIVIKLRLLFATGLLAVLLNSCTSSNEQYPEGYVCDEVPAGYSALAVAGITYWALDDHYYRYWPGYGYVVVPPPHGRPPLPRPPARPVPPIARPPIAKPPSIQPVPNPSTRPSIQPVRPSMPSVRPMPRVRARR